MVGFRDLRLELISNDSIMADAMRNPRVRDHEVLAQQMAEWELTNKVTIVPMGVYKESSQKITKDENLKSAQDGRDKYNKAKAGSGHMNVHFDDKTGAYAVAISRHYVGTFRTLSEAVEARDAHRAKVGLPKARY